MFPSRHRVLPFPPPSCSSCSRAATFFLEFDRWVPEAPGKTRNDRCCVCALAPERIGAGHRAVRVMARSRSEAEAAVPSSTPASASLRSPRSLHWPRPLFRARDRDGDKDGGRDHGGRDGDTDRDRNRD